MKKFLIGLVLLISMNVSARTFYVSQFGDDTRTVTEAQSQSTPWQTLSNAESNVANGDSVLFAKGSKFTGTLTLNSKSNIYFGVYGTGAGPLFWGTGNTLSVLITLNTCTNITFYDWTISDTTISATDRYIVAKIQNVFVTYERCTGVVIRKCKMDRIGYGAYFTPFSNGNTMDSCDIGNLRMIKNTRGIKVNGKCTNGLCDDDYGGVPIQLSSRNNTVTNNYFHDCYAASYDYIFDGGGVEFFEEGDTVKGNIVKYNTFYDCNGVFEFGSSSGLLRPHADNIIAYNKVINSSSLVYINNNPGAGYTTKVINLQLYNNVILQTAISRTDETNMISMYTSDATAGIVVMKNNIFQLSNGVDVVRSGQWTEGQLVHTNNIYKLSSSSILNFTLDGTEISTSGTIWVNTSDANPINWDYKLTSTSPANNSGVNIGITRDFNNNVVGTIPDIGILEFNVSTPAVSGRKFYFSTSGSDANDGLSPSTPWQTLQQLQTFSTSALPGDTFAFKCGDLFANGNNRRISMEWNNSSGTATNPIVFTYYGDLTLGKPNFLFPRPTNVSATDRYNMCFKSASYLVFDGLQFNDIRFPVNDKRTSAYTASGLMFGESISSKSFYCVIKNCYFSNIGYGVLGDCDNCSITNNTFTNFKSVGDTLGTFDIGADALQISGKKYRITNNYISGSWAYANPDNSSSNGLLGGALETINDFDSSFVAYNTFIDNSGGMEFGQNRGIQYGPNDDTFAYNIFINNSNVIYINTTGTFRCSASNMHFWNNVVIENQKSRFSGKNGGDAMGNGQTFSSTGFIFFPPKPYSKSTVTPANQNYYNMWREFDSGDQTQGNVGDTLYDIRNNIIWITTGLQAKNNTVDRPRNFYKNNIYHLVGAYQNPTILGSSIINSDTPYAVLSSGERIRNGKLFVDTSNAFPQNWDFHIFTDTSYAVSGGTNVGITKDFAGNTVSGTPTIGIYQYSATPKLTVSSTNVTCKTATNGTITASASGGTSPYLYKINNLAYRSSGSFTGLAPNTYIVYVKDSKGVVRTLNVTIKSSNVVCP